MTNRRFPLVRVLLVFLCGLVLCWKAAAAEQAAQSLTGDKKNNAVAKTAFSKGLQALLDDILKADEWKTADVMELVPQLQLFREELAEFQQLPNLEALKGKFPNDRTVQVLELCYRYAVHKSYQAVEKEIEKIDGWNNDARLVLLATECVVHLDGSNFARQRELGRRLVELEPGNAKFRQALAWIEEQLANSGTAVQPRRGTAK